MKKTIRGILCAVLAAAMVFALAGCAKINYVTNGTITAIKSVQDGTWNQTESTDDATEDVAAIEAFVPGTYGGVQFDTLADVAAYYVEAYNYTKSLTAEYIDADGNRQTFYKLLGDENLSVGDVMIDGSANKIVNGVVPGIVDNLMSKNTYGLVPCNNRNPETDNNLDDDTRLSDRDFRTSYVTEEDILEANITDNGDGTITMVIQPKSAQMSMRGEDSQGRFFEVLGDIGSVVASIDMVSFETGTPEENIIVDYRGGTASVTINTATKEIVEADYTMLTNVYVNHASILVIKDKSASLLITYTNHYPATDEYLKEVRNLTRV